MPLSRLREISTPSAAALDVADADAVEALIAKRPPDACVHLAAVSAIPAARRDPGLAWRVNLHGTLHIAEALRRHAPDAVLIYPSSADAYGRSFRSGRPLDESAALAPLNIYGATKAAAELALGAMAADGLRTIILRPFNHTGPGQSADFVVPAFARQIARIEAGLQAPVLNVGALEPMRDFLDVRDVSEAYVASISHADAIESGTILNIASGIPRRIGDILDDLTARASVRTSIETGTALLRSTEIPTAAGDASAAREALGWVPAIPWATTLQDVLDDWRARVRAQAVSG